MPDDTSMVLVPREPTEAMLEAAAECYPRSHPSVFPVIYRAMLSALSASPTVEEIKKAAYRDGWNDRESDFLVGAARVSQPDVVRDCIERVADGSMSSDDALSALSGRIDNDR